MGDEGKGKIVDLLTPFVKAVVRYQGGHNAGHTLKIKNQNDFTLDSFRYFTSACDLLHW